MAERSASKVSSVCAPACFMGVDVSGRRAAKLVLRGLTFEVRRDLRQDARPARKMICLSASRAWRLAVGPRLDRRVRPHSCCTGRAAFCWKLRGRPGKVRASMECTSWHAMLATDCRGSRHQWGDRRCPERGVAFELLTRLT